MEATAISQRPCVLEFATAVMDQYDLSVKTKSPCRQSLVDYLAYAHS